MNPTEKDTAEFYALALGYGLSNSQEVLRWADKLIESHAKPASWLVDLSMVKENCPADVITALHCAPGSITEFLPTKMLLVRAKSLLQQGIISGQEIGRLMVQLIQLRLLPSEFVADAYRIDDGFDLAGNVWSREQAEAVLKEFFEKLTAFEDLKILN